MKPDIAKCILMTQLMAPIIPQFATSCPDDVSMDSFITTSLYDIPSVYINQMVFNKVISKFAIDTSQFPELISENPERANLFFSKTIELLSAYNPSNIVFSLTTSDSLYFRIYKGSKEIHLEVFFSKYEKDDNIEAVISKYENDDLLIKDFGTLNDVFNNHIYSKDSAIESSEATFEHA